jgi:hypothetical protein
MTVRLGILALLEAKPGKGDELAAFLQAGRELAVAEQGTVTWYAFKISDTRYGIFETPSRPTTPATPTSTGRSRKPSDRLPPTCSPAIRTSAPSTSSPSSSAGPRQPDTTRDA